MTLKRDPWRALFALALLSAGFLGFFHVGRESLWADEAISVYRSRQPWDQLLALFADPIGDRPLYWPVLKLWMDAFGSSEAAIRSLSVLWGLWTIAMIYAVGRRIVGPQAAAVASLLLAGSPLFVWYMQEARMYTMWVLFTLLSFYGYLRLLDGARKGSWALYLLGTLGVVLTHQVGILIPTIQAVYSLTGGTARQFLKAHRRPVALLAGALLVLVGASAPSLWSKLTGIPERLGDPYLLSFHTVLGNYAVGLHAWYQEALPWALLLIGMVNGFFLWGLLQLPWVRALLKRLRLFPKRWAAQPAAGQHLNLLLIWIALGTFLAWMGTGLVQHWQIRFTLAGLPAYFLLAGLGLAQLLKLPRVKSWALAAALCAILALNAFSLQHYYTHPTKPQFRQAAYALSQLAKGADTPIYGLGGGERRSLEYYGVSRLQEVQGIDSPQRESGMLELWFSWLGEARLEQVVLRLDQIAQQTKRFVLVVADHPHPRCACADLASELEDLSARLSSARLVEAQAFFRVWVGLFERSSP